MAGIGLYLMQQKRDRGTVEYNNPNELITLIEDSKMLKLIHPELHETFKFDDNLKVLYEMQQAHLNEQSRTVLDNAYNNGASKQNKIDVDFLDDSR